MSKNKKTKPKVVYKEDDGRTIYSMAGLEGRTPEELEERDKQRKNRVKVTHKERRAMIAAAFQVYGPMLLIILVGFGLAATIVYLLFSR